jgi:hypothetical protein
MNVSKLLHGVRYQGVLYGMDAQYLSKRLKWRSQSPTVAVNQMMDRRHPRLNVSASLDLGRAGPVR